MAKRTTGRTSRAAPAAVVLGADGLARAVRAALRGARREALFVVSPGTLRAAFEHLLPDLRACVARGVAVRLLTRVGFDGLEAVEELLAAGVRVRDLPDEAWPTPTLLVDARRTLLFPLRADVEDLRAGRAAVVRLGSAPLARALSDEFDERWRRSASAAKALGRFRVRGKYASARLR